MYYTATAEDTVILGALTISKFSPNPTENTDCFSVEGSANEFFLLCSSNGKCPNIWKSSMTKLFAGEFKGCPKSEGVAKAEKKKTMIHLELQPMLIQPEPAPDCKFDFNYKMNGVDWVCNCNVGME